MDEQDGKEEEELKDGETLEEEGAHIGSSIYTSSRLGIGGRRNPS